MPSFLHDTREASTIGSLLDLSILFTSYTANLSSNLLRAKSPRRADPFLELNKHTMTHREFMKRINDAKLQNEKCSFDIYPRSVHLGSANPISLTKLLKRFDRYIR